MSIRFSCTDFTFPLLAHGDVFRLISMLGIHGVDIGLLQDRSHIQPSHIAADPAAAGTALRRQLEEHGLEAADIFLQSALDFVSVAVNHPSAGVREKSRRDFLDALSFASASGSSHITCLPGVCFEEDAEGESWKRACSELLWRTETAAAKGIAFGVEAHRGSIADTPALAKALVRDVNGLTLTLDYSHFIRSGFSQEEISPLLAFAGHFHARGASSKMMQTPVCESEIDFGLLVRDMQKYGYNKTITLEYVYENWEDNFRCDTISETVLLKNLLEASAPESQSAV